MTLDQYLFPSVWFPCLGALSWLLYSHYIQKHPYVHATEQQWLNIYGVCFIYLGVEAGSRLKRLYYDMCSGRTNDDDGWTISSNDDVCCIIPCHKSGDSLRTILPTILESFSTGNVYVADNGNERDVETIEVCQDYGVHYVFYDIPNKTYALLETAKVIEKERQDIQYTVLIDDDTHVEPPFKIRKDILAKPLVAGYSSNIGIHSPSSFWEYLVDFEYKSISYHNASKPCIQFCHGIIAVYHLRKMITIYSKLCTLPGGLPFGEDSFAGIDFRLAGYRLMQDEQNMVHTFCPKTLFNWPCQRGLREQGFGASSLFKQRVLRWYLSWPRRVLQELSLFFIYDCGSWWENFQYRLFILWYFFIVIVSSSWFFFAAHIAVQHTWKENLYLHGFLFATNVGGAYIRMSGFHPNMRKDVRWFVPLLIPLMNITVCCFMSMSLCISLFYYIPFNRVNYDLTYAHSL
jgi:hypothetical protein